MVVLERVLVVDCGDETFVGDVQERQARRFVDAATLGFDDAVFDLIAHAETVSTADGIGFAHQIDPRRELAAVDRHRPAFVKAHAHVFGLDLHLRVVMCNAHDWRHDVHRRRQLFK